MKLLLLLWSSIRESNLLSILLSPKRMLWSCFLRFSSPPTWSPSNLIFLHFLTRITTPRTLERGEKSGLLRGTSRKCSLTPELLGLTITTLWLLTLMASKSETTQWIQSYSNLTVLKTYLSSRCQVTITTPHSLLPSVIFSSSFQKLTISKIILAWIPSYQVTAT